MHKGLPHLHVASGFSARFGASHPRDLVTRAAERGIGTLALTDRDMVTGTVRFAKAASAAGVRPLFGVDLGVAASSPTAPAARRRTPVRGGAHVAEAPFRATFLAQNARGWARLCRMVSAAHASAFPTSAPPTASWEHLHQHADNELVVLLGPASEPLRALSMRPYGHRRKAVGAVASDRGSKSATGDRVLGPVRHRPGLCPPRRPHPRARRPSHHPGRPDQRRPLRRPHPAPDRGRAGRGSAAAAHRSAAGSTAVSAGSRTNPR